MRDYSQVRRQYGEAVSQTIDQPIEIFDFWQLSDAFVTLAVVMIFGILLDQWMTMFVILLSVLWVVPVVRKKNPRGIFLHWPYRVFGMSLPGLVNPGGLKRKFSD